VKRQTPTEIDTQEIQIQKHAQNITHIPDENPVGGNQEAESSKTQMRRNKEKTTERSKRIPKMKKARKKEKGKWYNSRCKT